jgi:hypothetical protein
MPKRLNTILEVIHNTLEVIHNMLVEAISTTDWGKSPTPYLMITRGIDRDEAKLIVLRPTPTVGSVLPLGAENDQSTTTRQALADPAVEKINVPRFMIAVPRCTIAALIANKPKHSLEDVNPMRRDIIPKRL